MTKPHVLKIAPYPAWDPEPLDLAFHVDCSVATL